MSTVLEALRVASTSRSLVPEEYRAMCGRDARTTRAPGSLVVRAFRPHSGGWLANPKSEIRNSKFLGGNSKLKTKNSKLFREVDGWKIRNPKSEIRNSAEWMGAIPNSEFRIPNSFQAGVFVTMRT